MFKDALNVLNGVTYSLPCLSNQDLGFNLIRHVEVPCMVLDKSTNFEQITKKKPK